MKLKLYEYIVKLESLFSERGWPEIVWLASFPRSGNTWMRFLLTNLLFDRVEKSSDISLYIPDIYIPEELEKTLRFGKGIFNAFNGKKVLIVKSHLPFQRDMILRERTAGAIYILRNPIDVAVSAARMGLFGANKEQYKKEFNVNFSEEQQFFDDIESFVTYGATRREAYYGFGTWHGHVQSWLQVAKQQNLFPILTIKYEALKEDTYSQISKVMNFLKLPIDKAKIKEAIEASSLSKMKEMQEREIKNRIPGAFFSEDLAENISKGRRFLFKGESGTGAKIMTPKQYTAALRLFGNLMKKFGYL